MAPVVIKLGSSVVAGDEGHVRIEVIERVCAEVAELHGAGDGAIIVTSGAIARGIGAMGLGARPRAMDELQAASAVGQGKLYRIYDELLAARGVSSAQVLLTFFDMSARMHYLNARRALRRLLDWRTVPVVNENDTTATDEITFGDNDFLSAQVALLLGARLLVLLTDTTGLYTADPRHDDSAELVRRVDDFAELGRLEIGDRTSIHGSGGMRSKVAAAEMASAAGIPAVICDGTAAGTLVTAAGGGEVGTRFVAHPERTPSFKLWLRYAKPARGRIGVDAGAARVLRERGSSLLPVGITAVDGEFDAGDAVEVVCDGELVGKGISNYSAYELGRIMGMKSAQITQSLPGGSEEAVHRDRFVLA